MKELFERLRQKERKLLEALGIFLLIILLFYVFVGRGLRGSYTRAQALLTTRRADLKKFLTLRDEKRKELASWKQARKDMEELRDKYFYSPKTVSQCFRQDIEKIFRNSGLKAPSIRFDYKENSLQKIDKAWATFTVPGNYYLLKRFVHQVEIFPKFLILEKIDFADINVQTGAQTVPAARECGPGEVPVPFSERAAGNRATRAWTAR
jgi:Tfp pilus assembly protein PilO